MVKYFRTISRYVAISLLLVVMNFVCWTDATNGEINHMVDLTNKSLDLNSSFIYNESIHYNRTHSNHLNKVHLVLDIIRDYNDSCTEKSISCVIKHAFLQKSFKEYQDMVVDVVYNGTDNEHNKNVSFLNITIATQSHIDVATCYELLKSLSLNPKDRNSREDVIIGGCWLKYDPETLKAAIAEPNDSISIYFGYNIDWMISLIVICGIVVVLIIGCLILICWAKRPLKRKSNKIHEIESGVRFKTRNEFNSKTPILLTTNKIKPVKSAPQLKD